MCALAANAFLSFEAGAESYNDLPVKAATKIYKGAAVGDDSGYARGLVAGDPFRGFAVEQADNTSGAAAAIYVRVRAYGAAQLAVTSVAITDVGKDVFASADGTFVLTQSTNTRIGFVKRWISSGVAIVEFKAQHGSQAELAGTLTGTVDGTMEDIAATAGGCQGGAAPSATQVDTAIATAVASIVTGANLQLKELLTKANALIRQLGE